MDYLLRKLCGFCICIQLFVRVERLLIYWKYWFSDLEGSLICYCLCNHSFLIESFDYPIFRVLLGSFSAWAVCYDCIVWKIQFLGFRQVLFLQEMFVVIGPSVGSDLEGSVKFFIRRAACDSTSKLVFMIGRSRGSDIYVSVEFFIQRSACDSPSDLTSFLSCWSW